MKSYCCEQMAYFAEHRCPEHDNPFDCPDHIIYANSKHNLYGIIVHDGGESFISIDYCPWCGKRLSEE